MTDAIRTDSSIDHADGQFPSAVETQADGRKPLFGFDAGFKEDLQKNVVPDQLRLQFKDLGYPLSGQVSLKTWGTKYILIDHATDFDSYILAEEEDGLGAYTAFVVMGEPDSFRQLDAKDFFTGLNGPYEVMYLEFCEIIEPLVVAGSDIPQDAEEQYRLDKEIVCRNCVFNHPVDFSNTTLLWPVDFRGTAFRKSVEVRGAVFQDSCNFDLATFEESVHFVRSTFNKATHFSGAKLQGEALFYRAVFQDSCGFNRAEFSKHADFSEAAFQNGIGFAETVFNSGADFARAQFYQRANFTGAISTKPIEFPDVRYWPNSIGQWWRRKILNEWGYRFMWSNYEGQATPRWLARQLLRDRKYPDGPPQQPTEFLIEGEHISEVSSPLFKRYVADMLFIRAFREESPVLAWLWQWSADYGRSLLVWGFWSAMVVLFFALWYTPSDTEVPLVGWQLPEWWQAFWGARGPQFHQTADVYLNQPLSFWSAVYFSVVTFTTLGFGDIATANGTARVVTTLEVIMGYVMLGGLISILAHKLARRS